MIISKAKGLKQSSPQQQKMLQTGERTAVVGSTFTVQYFTGMFPCVVHVICALQPSFGHLIPNHAGEEVALAKQF